MMAALAVVLGIACAGLAVAALYEGHRAVRIAGWWLATNGIAWFTPDDHVPSEARPPMRRTLQRWALPMRCLLLAGIAGALA